MPPRAASRQRSTCLPCLACGPACSGAQPSPIGKREALLVPQSAVLERGQVRSVYVVQGDTARLRLVTLGETRDNRCEILSGLTAGEKILVAPPPLLSDGNRVAIQEASK